MFNNSKTKLLGFGTSLCVCFLSYYLWKKDIFSKYISFKPGLKLHQKDEKEEKQNVDNKEDKENSKPEQRLPSRSWADKVEEEEEENKESK